LCEAIQDLDGESAAQVRCLKAQASGNADFQETDGVNADTGLPVGMAGLRYPITQVSLVVDDIDALLERYYRAFGWAPWQDFDHVPPVHRDTMYRGKAVEYSLRGAEVYVGSLNFELLKPLPGGESLFHDHLTQRGEGIASIASMFHEQSDGEAVKAAFKELFGLEIINRAKIGDHIEYFYADTQRDFGCPIESGSGHAIDFVGPARVYPRPDSEFGPSPESGITYRISQVTLVVLRMDEKVRNYRRAFGWGPWKIYDTRKSDAFLSQATFRGSPTTFDVRVAQAMVGDINFELVEPHGGPSPWQEYLDDVGEGLIGFGVTPDAPLDAVLAHWSSMGVSALASAHNGPTDWCLLDTQERFKTRIAVASAYAHDVVSSDEVR
jgi:hypothetical protein